MVDIQKGVLLGAGWILYDFLSHDYFHATLHRRFVLAFVLHALVKESPLLAREMLIALIMVLLLLLVRSVGAGVSLENLVRS